MSLYTVKRQNVYISVSYTESHVLYLWFIIIVVNVYILLFCLIVKTFSLYFSTFAGITAII